ncbi:MAG: hypothetical protein K0S55_667 [Clostridia bacterium]|jgi:NADP-reducing hydrogenase subunit HndA|nr:hypothetical protein [Clostridia bacterium]
MGTGKQKISNIPFSGTAEQKEKLSEVINKLKETKGALMPIMQEAQEIYGYLPIEVQKMIANEMNIPLEEVYGVATFYSQFSLNPKGVYKVSVCLGTACYVRGSQDVADKVKTCLSIDDGGITPDGKFSYDATRCIGCCGLAPVMVINDDVYGRLTADEVPGILKKYQNK